MYELFHSFSGTFLNPAAASDVDASGASVNRNKNPSSLCQSFIICPPLSMFFTDRAAVTANGGASTSNFLSHFAVRSARTSCEFSARRSVRTASSIVSIFLGEKSSP